MSNNFVNLNYFINRVKEYQTKGRSQTEIEANDVANQIKAMLRRNQAYIEVEGNISGLNEIAHNVLLGLDIRLIYSIQEERTSCRGCEVAG